MKLLVLYLQLLLFSSIIYAQSYIPKGTYTINGEISYSNQTYDNNNVSNELFTFNPQFGYFFFNNFYTALSLSYIHSKSDNTKSDIYGIGPAIRYYFNSKKLKPFMGIGYIFNEQTQNPYNLKTTSNEWKLIGGVDYFVTNNFALEASINISFINYNYNYGTALNPINGTTSEIFQVGIGVNYFIK